MNVGGHGRRTYIYKAFFYYNKSSTPIRRRHKTNAKRNKMKRQWQEKNEFRTCWSLYYIMWSH